MLEGLGSHVLKEALQLGLPLLQRPRRKTQFHAGPAAARPDTGSPRREAGSAPQRLPLLARMMESSTVLKTSTGCAPTISPPSM